MATHYLGSAAVSQFRKSRISRASASAGVPIAQFLTKVQSHKIPKSAKSGAHKDRVKDVEQSIGDSQRRKERYEYLLEQFDTDGDRQLDKDEFRNLMESHLKKHKERIEDINYMKTIGARVGEDAMAGQQQAGLDGDDILSDGEVDFVFGMTDWEKSGKIPGRMLLKALQFWDCYRPLKKRLDGLFRRGDTDNSGELDRKEVHRLLVTLNGGHAVTEEEVDWIFAESDVNGDGNISKHELYKATIVWYEHAASVDTHDDSRGLGDGGDSGIRSRGCFCFSSKDRRQSTAPQ